MYSESPQRKPPSPRASTEVSSLQKNKCRNSEALERRLSCRRPVKELVNQGIMLNPTIGNALKVKELQRAKTADILKRKIERRPDKQMLINQRILRVSDTGASPLIQEKCNALIRNQLCESLNSKLEQRLGSLELVEKGVLKVDPGVATLIRSGSIPYPRVASTSPSQLSTVPEESVDVEIVPPPPPPLPSVVPSKISRSSKPRTPSRSLKDETVISRYGSLVFHNYRPSSAASSNSPSLRSTPAPSSTSSNSGSTSVRLPKHRAREVQQAELLHLEDAVQVHRRLSQEICQLGGVPPHKVAQTASNHHQDPTQPQVFQQVLLGQPQPQQSATCYILQQNPVSTPQPPPTPAQPAANGLFLTTQHIFDNAGAAVVALSNNPIGAIEAGVAVQQTTATSLPSTASVPPPPPPPTPPPPPLTPVLNVASSPISTKTGINNGVVEPSEPSSTHKVAALAEIEAVLLDVRRIRDEIDQELCRVDSNHAANSKTDWHYMNELIKQHDNACSLARLLISDRLEYLDEITPQQNGGGDDPQKLHSGLELERKFLVGRLERLRRNSVTLTQQRQQQRDVPQSQAWFSPCLQEANCAHFPSDANGVVQRRPHQQQHRQAPLVWGNSTILAASESENMLYNHHHQQQQQQGVPVQPISCQAGQLKTNGSLVELPSSTWMEPVYDAVPCQSSLPPNPASANQHVNVTTVGVQQLNNGNSIIGASATAMHTTASMPANLHLINNSGPSVPDPSAASMLLTPNLNDEDFGHGSSSAACAFLDSGDDVAGGGGGSSGNSAAFATTNTTATTESSVGSINGADGDLMLMMDMRKPYQTFDDVHMEISPSYLYGIPSPPRSHNHEPSDVQDFLSNFGDVPMSNTKHCSNTNGVDDPSMTEDQLGLVLDYGNTNGYSENGGMAYSSINKAPPGPQFFASPPGEEEGDSDMLWSAGMDFS